MIKVPGKDFFNLTYADAADMIDAYLAGGDDKYDCQALSEFRLVPNSDWLENLRNEIIRIDLDKQTNEQRDGLDSDEGRSELAALSENLRQKSAQYR